MKAWEDKHIEPYACPNCGKHLDGLSSPWDIEADGPQSGDVTVCSGCAEPQLMDDDGAWRLPTATERLDIEAIPEFRKVRAAIRLCKEELARPDSPWRKRLDET